MLEEKTLSKYVSINLLERYKSLSEKFNSKEVLEQIDNAQVLERLKEFNSRFTFNQKEGFFGLNEQEGNFDFKFNLSLKYGLVEPVVWGKNVFSEDQYGGALIRVAKLIQVSMGLKTVERIMYPRFNSYDDLTNIIKVLYGIYEDFKEVIISKNSNPD
ncbi:MAG: hypothetical protein IPM04_01710 [Saprospiraceae bacterium]|nr:hypothetical protein [Candidatus Brachybacter algidus]MBK8746599.1 hypothetical protein [Candidatus Brachybacter algidus]